MLIPSEVVAQSPEDQLSQSLLSGYKKKHHPPNDVTLLFSISYVECPTPSAFTDQILSKVVETEVGLLLAVAQPVLHRGGVG